MIQSATTYPAVLGQVVGALRETRGITQAQLGAAVGVSQSTWSKIERGDSALSVEQLRSAAEMLGTTAAHLLAEADRAAHALERQGVKVHASRVEAPASSTFALMGMAALGALLGGVVVAVATSEDEEPEAPASKAPKRRSKPG